MDTKHTFESLSSSDIEGVSFKCSACGNSFNGLANPIKNSKKCWIFHFYYDYHRYFAACDDQKCFAKVKDNIKGCLECGELSFNIDESDKAFIAEDRNICEISCLCSRDCKIARFNRYEEEMEKGIDITRFCAICKKESYDMFRCDKCKIKYYCSKKCQIEHDKICKPH